VNIAHSMQWRPYIHSPGYEISECGDVRYAATRSGNKPGRQLKGSITPDGYIAFCLTINGVKVHRLSHRLVAETFIGLEPFNGAQVAHLNGSKIMNHWSNLGWVSVKENQTHRAIHGTSSAGERNPKAIITENDVRAIRRRYYSIKMERGDVSQLERDFGIGRSQIIRIAKKEAWSHVV